LSVQSVLSVLSVRFCRFGSDLLRNPTQKTPKVRQRKAKEGKGRKEGREEREERKGKGKGKGTITGKIANNPETLINKGNQPFYCVTLSI